MDWMASERGLQKKVWMGWWICQFVDEVFFLLLQRVDVWRPISYLSLAEMSRRRIFYGFPIVKAKEKSSTSEIYTIFQPKLLLIWISVENLVKYIYDEDDLKTAIHNLKDKQCALQQIDGRVKEITGLLSLFKCSLIGTGFVWPLVINYLKKGSIGTH
jgi:hypothetical protein